MHRYRLFVTVLIFTQLFACATNAPQIPDYYASKSVGPNADIQKIALVKVLTPPEIESIDFGITHGQGAVPGAALGALEGFTLWGSGRCEGSICGAWALLLPAFVTIGAFIGAGAGAQLGYPPEALKEAEANARAMLQSDYMQKQLVEHTQAYAMNNTDLQFHITTSADPGTRAEKPNYAMLAEEGFDSVLELKLTRLSFDWQILSKPTPSLKMEARERLISVNTGTVLSDEKYNFISGARPLEEWAANGGAILAAAIEQGLQTLAEDIIDENFLLFYPIPPFDEGLTHAGAVDGQTPIYRSGPVPIYVLKPYYPALEHCFFCEGPFSSRPHRAIGSLEFVMLNSLQPTFRWEHFPNIPGRYSNLSEVRYDIKVFEAGQAPDNSLVLVPNKLVYDKRDIPEPKHRIENRLKPCTDYFWTVRARFEVFARERVTEWAGAFNVGGWNEKPWNLRRGFCQYMDPRPFLPAILPDGPEWFYYPFKTPCDQ